MLGLRYTLYVDNLSGTWLGLITLTLSWNGDQEGNPNIIGVGCLTFVGNFDNIENPKKTPTKRKTFEIHQHFSNDSD